MSFLKIGDRAAGARSSRAARRRRAAKMVCGRFGPSGYRRASSAGKRCRRAEGGRTWSRARKSAIEHLNAIMTACHERVDLPSASARTSTRSRTRFCAKAVVAARQSVGPRELSSNESFSWPVRAYTSKSNSRPTIRIGIRKLISPSRVRTRTTRSAIPNDFIEAVLSPTTSGTLITSHRRSNGLKDHARRGTSGTKSRIPPGPAADPGVQFDSTINEWHTCPELRPDQCLQSRVPSTCSWTTRPAISRP